MRSLCKSRHAGCLPTLLIDSSRTVSASLGTSADSRLMLLMLLLMLMSFFVDDHYVCYSVAGWLCSIAKARYPQNSGVTAPLAGLFCSRPMAHGDTNELKAPAAL